MRTGFLSPKSPWINVSEPTAKPWRYHLRTAWLIAARAEEISDVMMDVAGYSRWWRCAFLRSELVRPGAEHHSGALLRLQVKGFLPHTLTFLLEIERAEANRGFVGRARGDFEGSAACWAEPRDRSHFTIHFDWHVEVNKPFVRYLSPLARRLFVQNHRWVMGRGRHCLQLELWRRRQPSSLAAAVPASPRPVFPHNLEPVRRLYSWLPEPRVFDSRSAAG